MSKEIRELYQKLYNENYTLLEVKKKEVNRENAATDFSFAKSIVSYRLYDIIRNIISILSVTLLLPVMLTNPKIVVYIILPIGLLIAFIALIYQIVVFPRKSIQKNFNLTISTKYKNEYNYVFCELICKPIIEHIVPNSKYDHNFGMPQEIYDNMGFSANHELYFSTDNISLSDEPNLTISKVHSKFKERNLYGFLYSTLFYGIVSNYKLDFDLPLSIRIRNKKLGSLKLKNTVQLSNEEFNQYYEIHTNNIDLLGKYFTNRMMEYFIELAEKNINLEVNIFQDRICTRLYYKDFLSFYIESKLDEEDEEKVVNSCNFILAIIETNKFLVKELKNIKNTIIT